MGIGAGCVMVANMAGKPFPRMQPTFILAYPRSRTAWLSMFLTGAGAFTFHEAWKLVDNVKDLRLLMESKGPGPVVNSDCANALFLPELLAEFPEAKYIRLIQDEDLVIQSLYDSYGVADYHPMFETYRRALDGFAPDLTVDCSTWDHQTSRDIWACVSEGQPIDNHWVEQCEGMLVQLMPWQIQTDIDQARLGMFNHIVTKLRG